MCLKHTERVDPGKKFVPENKSAALEITAVVCIQQQVS